MSEKFKPMNMCHRCPLLFTFKFQTYFDSLSNYFTFDSRRLESLFSAGGFEVVLKDKAVLKAVYRLPLSLGKLLYYLFGSSATILVPAQRKLVS